MLPDVQPFSAWVGVMSPEVGREGGMERGHLLTKEDGQREEKWGL